MSARTRRWAAVAVAGVLLAGCSAPDDDPTPSPTASPGASPTAETPDGDATEAPDDDAAGEDDASGDAGAAPAPGTAGDALPTAPPVALDEPADFGTGVTATLAAVRAIQAEAHGPGEIAGPALAFEVVFTNGGSAPVSLDTVTVNLFDATGTPGSPMVGSPADPVEGELGPGATTTGVYVFTVPPDARSTVSLEVSYTTDAHVVVFQGDPSAI